MRIIAHCLGFMAALLPVSALAADWSHAGWGGEFGSMRGSYADYSFENDNVRLRAGMGALLIGGDEYVFNGNRVLSHLIWQSAAPVLRGGFDVRLGAGFSISAQGGLAGYGTSYMEDYDWMVPTDNFDDWTHRSQHPDTNLDHYFTGEVVLGYDLARYSDANVRLHAGFRYTDVSWSSFGGSYIYSENGFRDRVGNFADGEPAIAYRQRLPEVFVGVDGEERYGDLRIGGLLRGGVTVNGNATDNHWMRDLRVEDSFNLAPTLSLGADAGYAFGRMAEIFAAIRYDQHFEMRGRADYIDTNTNLTTFSGADIAGAGLKTLSLTAGIKGQF